ncbi:MAG TPA: hypothetical protein VIN75_02920, partial [Burkholderiaceae bacterium]
ACAGADRMEARLANEELPMNPGHDAAWCLGGAFALDAAPCVLAPARIGARRVGRSNDGNPASVPEETRPR